MKTFKKQTVSETVIDTITCNGCENKINYGYDDRMDFTHRFGYNSKKFGDMTTIHFDLCEACIYKLTKTFKIPHAESSYFDEIGP
jgi:hypothetical protein